MDEQQIIIDDQKKTIHRLQDECTEKTNAIIALGERLKTKEQECEKLKNWVKNMMFDTDREDWFEHFVECFEKWKEDLFKQLDQLKAENKLFRTCHDNEQAKRRKYEQALTEIKGIAGKQCNICEALTPIDEYKDCEKCWQGVILQKIKEVLNGTNP